MTSSSSTARLRLLAALLPLVACSGCIGLTGTSSSQPLSMGPMTLSFSACATGAPACSATSNSGTSVYSLLGPTDVVPTQVLAALRLPEGAAPPDVLSATVGAGPGLLTFQRSPSYEAELNRFAPPPAGQRWWGWISATADYSQDSAQSIAISVTTPLWRPADGGPLPSPVSWRPVVGSREVAPGPLIASRPVSCGSSAKDFFEGYSELNQVGITIACVDSPSPATTATDLGAVITDFGIVGSPLTAPAGSTVTATFLARRSGPADPSTTFALAAGGGPPGASVTLDRTTAPLGDDATIPVLATVHVPAGTPAGSYPLTLKGTAAGKPTRVGTAALTVPPASGGGGTPDTTAPVITAASLSRTRFRVGSAPTALSARARAGTKVRVSLSEPAALALKVDRLRAGRRSKGRCSRRARSGTRCTISRRVATLTRALPRGASAIAFSGRIGSDKLAPGRYRLVLVATDAAGNRSRAERLRFRLVRR